MEISFLPGRISSLTLSVLRPSVLTNYVRVYVRICISVQVLVKAHAVEQLGFAPGKYNCLLNPLILVPIVYYIGRYVLKCSKKQQKTDKRQVNEQFRKGI